MACDLMRAKFGLSRPSERDMVFYYLSREAMDHLTCQFGALDTVSMSCHVRSMLSYLLERHVFMCRRLNWSLGGFDETLHQLVRAGLLMDGPYMYEDLGFVSTMTERHLHKLLFPARASRLQATSLVDLVRDVIESFSVSELQESIQFRSDGIPTATAFQYLVMVLSNGLDATVVDHFPGPGALVLDDPSQ